MLGYFPFHINKFVQYSFVLNFYHPFNNSISILYCFGILKFIEKIVCMYAGVSDCVCVSERMRLRMGIRMWMNGVLYATVCTCVHVWHGNNDVDDGDVVRCGMCLCLSVCLCVYVCTWFAVFGFERKLCCWLSASFQTWRTKSVIREAIQALNVFFPFRMRIISIICAIRRQKNRCLVQ